MARGYRAEMADVEAMMAEWQTEADIDSLLDQFEETVDGSEWQEVVAEMMADIFEGRE